MRIICALLRPRNRMPGNSGSVVSDPMAGMWKFELRPEGQLLADTGGSRSRPSHPVTALLRCSKKTCGWYGPYAPCSTHPCPQRSSGLSGSYTGPNPTVESRNAATIGKKGLCELNPNDDCVFTV